jgi:chromosome partitioning protein
VPVEPVAVEPVAVEPVAVEPVAAEPVAAPEPAAAPAESPGAAPTTSSAPDRVEDEPEAGPGEATETQEADATEHRGAHSTAPALGNEVLPLPRVIAIANQKGGVGKTTTAVNLGAALAEAGYRTLVVDLDPQGNASTGLGISPRDVETSVYDVIMTDAPALDCVEPTSLKNLFVLPATIDLAGAEIELVAAFSRELKLRRALDAVRLEYDVILIDCPPSLGLLTVNGLAAADDVIVPVQSEYYALEGLGQLLKNVSMVRSVNPTLDVRGIVLTMHDARTKLAEQVESEVRLHFGTKVYKTVVPRTVRLSEAPSFGQPIIVFDPTSRGASAYRELAKEVSGGATRRPG